MPNWISNTLHISGPGSEELFEKLTAGEGFSFKNVIPMPEELTIVSSPVRAENFLKNEEEYQKALKQYKEDRKNSDYICGIPITKERHERYIRDYGTVSWYDWSIKNWGTKWDACDPYISEDTIEFNTAWSMPNQFYKAVSKMYPEVTFETTWYDEDYGSNLGTATFENGEITTQHIPDSQSREAYELLFELNECAREQFELVDGNYEYKEDY